jgi:CheY-like chemotaxis protein
LLAGRKLLLADDSITIQKVVDLTFADEGVSVVCVDNGREAIERLADFVPDVVLADVFMPQVNGYELCEYIKQHEHLKHIPVMLLIGSFEPYDEEEARRVGANDTLTKPFQSIRRLIDKVGQLVSGRPPEEQIPTAELPRSEEPEPEVERLSTAELETSTADTRPLPDELRHVVEAAEASRAQQDAAQAVENQGSMPAAREDSPQTDNGMREQPMPENSNQVYETYEGAGEVLLDLGDISSAQSGVGDDFVLDIDLDELPEPALAEAVYQMPVSSSVLAALKREPSPTATEWSTNPLFEESPAGAAPMAAPREFERVLDEPAEAPELPAVYPTRDQVETSSEAVGTTVEEVHAGSAATGEYSPAAVSLEAPPHVLSLGQLSPEMIDAIARRAVEQLSEKVVQEIAWEVVPQLAELLIKRQLDEKNS